MTQELLIAGGGIAGLAAAVAARRAGWEARLFEQAPVFHEVGAGLQLGPNATSVLRGWGLLDHPLLRPFAPPRLVVRDALDGRTLGQLLLGERALTRYGAPYLSVHRADLHATLLDAARSAGARLHPGTRIASAQVDGPLVQAQTEAGALVEAEALAVADGVWSALRTRLLGDGPAPPTGHVAFRALVPRAELPEALRGDAVEAWLGPRMHLVRYPVQGGEAMNIVGFIEGHGASGDWDQAADTRSLRSVAADLHRDLQALVAEVPTWRLWPVHDRDPVSSPAQMARGRAALMGDAAHPMRPYLAQGAGMAIEDAAELGRVLTMAREAGVDVPAAFQRYAMHRWERVGRVQARSRRNGRIFHAAGPLRLARNVAMALGGEGMMDVPWLYGGG